MNVHSWIFHQSTTLLHMTCAESTYLKFYIAGAYGGWQDVNNYYTNPPRILIMPSLSGSIQELETLMRLVVGAAIATNRSILPPLSGVFINSPEGETEFLATNGLDGTKIAHRKNIWSLFPLEEIEKEYGVTFLEPNYIEHATGYLASTRPDRTYPQIRSQVIKLTGLRRSCTRAQ